MGPEVQRELRSPNSAPTQRKPRSRRAPDASRRGGRLEDRRLFSADHLLLLLFGPDNYETI